MALTKTPIINTQLDTLNANVTATNAAITDGNSKLEAGLNTANTNLDTIGDNVAAVGMKLDAANTNLANITAQETAANTKRDATNMKLEAISGKIADSGSQLETLNSSLLSIGAKFDTMNDMFGLMVGKGLSDPVDLADIGRIVRAGQAKKVFSIGDQIIVPWKDTATDTEYSMPFDIVHIPEKGVTLQDGEVVPAMIIQSHYATPFGIQFDQNEALYYCESEMPAGTYYFTCANSWGSNIVSGKSYNFTLTKAVPAGGQIQIGLANSEIGACPDQNPANWRIRVYASSITITPTEILTLTEGATGTSLGSWSSSTKYASSGVNNMQRSSYGYNRWSQSGIRQWLNSTADKDKWWSPQNVFDRPPVELSSKNGFMSGFSDDFLNILKPIKITTALNTVSDSEIGTTEDTYDTFFLPSKRNMNLSEQLSGAEGEIWQYWYRATNGVKPKDYTNEAVPKTYAIDNHMSAQYVRLRSAKRGYADGTWCVNFSGFVHGSGAASSWRSAPACAIC